MSAQVRHRTAGAALALLFAAAPLLAGVPAGAEPEESGGQVVFNGGGLLGVTCSAQPDTREVTVTAGSSLLVVNRSGNRARLLLDGTAMGEIPDSSSTRVSFDQGPVSLSLKPSCVLSDDSPTVRVTVLPAAVAEPAPSPAAPAVQPNPAGSPAPVPTATLVPVVGGLPDAGSAPRPAAAPGGLPDKPAPGGTTRANRRAAVVTGGGAGMVVPGMPPGDAPGLTRAGADGVAPSIVASVVDAGTDRVAAEPVAALEPVSETGPIGLLAIIATICVAGVTAGAIRAIVAQRASRAGVA